MKKHLTFTLDIKRDILHRFYTSHLLCMLACEECFKSIVQYIFKLFTWTLGKNTRVRGLFYTMQILLCWVFPCPSGLLSAFLKDQPDPDRARQRGPAGWLVPGQCPDHSSSPGKAVHVPLQPMAWQGRGWWQGGGGGLPKWDFAYWEM